MRYNESPIDEIIILGIILISLATAIFKFARNNEKFNVLSFFKSFWQNVFPTFAGKRDQMGGELTPPSSPPKYLFYRSELPEFVWPDKEQQ